MGRTGTDMMLLSLLLLYLVAVGASMSVDEEERKLRATSVLVDDSKSTKEVASFWNRFLEGNTGSLAPNMPVSAPFAPTPIPSTAAEDRLDDPEKYCEDYCASKGYDKTGVSFNSCKSSGTGYFDENFSCRCSYYEHGSPVGSPVGAPVGAPVPPGRRG